jgi:hypothetical protein
MVKTCQHAGCASKAEKGKRFCKLHCDTLTLAEKVKATRTRKNPELLATFQLLVNAKLAQWDLEREIEKILGGELDGMNTALNQFCGGCGITHTCTFEDLGNYLEMIKEAGN